ncbi:MAG: hypothetical protein RJA57_1739 [Bacteroidota bacterium]|jgi:glycosyltransferase involved in cell wall biosynthesis
MARVVIIGPAHPLRGGLATFNHRLARAFIEQGHTCRICSFSLQYPSFLFPGKTQYSDEPPPQDIGIDTSINSVNPLNWVRIGRKLKKQAPDLVVVRFWLPFMGPALGTILRQIRKNGHTRIVCIADNILPHEKRIGDRPFTRYFLKSCDAFITMSENVMGDLRTLEATKPARMVRHPLYDTFGTPVDKATARAHLQIEAKHRLLLFFGFIRAYKGLDLLLEAMHVLKQRGGDYRLLIAGEFYEDPKKYRDLIEKWGLADQLILQTDFIPDAEVRYYLCAADAVVQPYRNATQSGVTPLAYHFERPMIVTNVGGLPAIVPDGKAGLVVPPEPAALANGIEQFFSLPEGQFLPFLREEKKKYNWETLVEAILSLAHSAA